MWQNWRTSAWKMVKNFSENRWIGNITAIMLSLWTNMKTLIITYLAACESFNNVPKYGLNARISLGHTYIRNHIAHGACSFHLCTPIWHIIKRRFYVAHAWSPSWMLAVAPYMLRWWNGIKFTIVTNRIAFATQTKYSTHI